MVKVSGGARTLAGVERHMKYIEKKGELGLETDMGTQAGGDGFAHKLVRDWDLDIDALKHYSKKHVRRGKPPKLVHNIVFSMPAGTSPKKVLAAVRKLALDEWALQHRYAMALHTDAPHPHVHVVVKAMREEGERLNIKKAALRGWRAQFAGNLRELGVAANSTERAVRGETRTHRRTPIYRVDQREGSGYAQKRMAKALKYPENDIRRNDPGFAVMERTRRQVVNARNVIVAKLRLEEDRELAENVSTFADEMPAAKTDELRLLEALRTAQGRESSNGRESAR